MSVLPIPDHVTPARLPTDDDVYLVVHTEESIFRVHYHAGAPFWVRRQFDNGTVALGMPVEIAIGEHAEAVAMAEAFLAQFRLPAVAS